MIPRSTRWTLTLKSSWMARSNFDDNRGASKPDGPRPVEHVEYRVIS